MFFVEDLNKTKQQIEQASEDAGLKIKQVFRLHGAAIGAFPQEAKGILEGQGYEIKKPEDMVNAVSDLFTEGGEKWEKFSYQFKPLLVKAADQIERKGVGQGEESGSAALIAGAVAQLGAGISNLFASKNERQTASIQAKSEMNKGLLMIIQEKEKRKTEAQRTKTWIIIAIVAIVLIGVVAAVVIMKNKKAKAAAQ